MCGLFRRLVSIQAYSPGGFTNGGSLFHFLLERLEFCFGYLLLLLMLLRMLLVVVDGVLEVLLREFPIASAYGEDVTG